MENEKFNQLDFNECQKLAATDDPDGIYLLGYCYEHGIGIEKDKKKAFGYYQKSAEMNNPNGMYQVGYCYLQGIGIEKDEHQAFTWYKKSADKGNSDGMYQVGYCYDLGIAVEINKDKAFEFYKNSVKAGNSKGFPKLITLSDEMGRTDGMLQVGNCYLQGIGIEKDECQASIWYKKAADMNDPEGICRLGYCYEYGIGFKKDKNKAFVYYQQSAKMGNSNGMYQVGYCYYLGIGVEIDKHKAFVHYLMSAEAGNSMGIWKTAVCYLYGIDVEKNYNKHWEWIKKDPSTGSHGHTFRDPKYGKCAHCNEDNTYKAWCLSCDPDIETRSTSRNKDIDDCLKAFQLRTFAYENAIEWIPFNRLFDIKEIGKGGFGSVYSAIWLDGVRKIDEIKTDDENYSYKRSREPNSTVALKTLFGSLREFENHMKCILYGSKLKIYGLTQDSENKYLMVFQYADNGNLHKFLEKNFRGLIWQTKLNLLKDISTDLERIHRSGYIHGDFHSGNILQNKGISENIKSYISDLGLSKKEDENGSEGGIYGVVPYVAPEVLLGKKFTKAADIYGFGVIMSEISTGQRPFDGYEFGTNLAIKICKGLRPEFAHGTPNCYIEFAKQCMDAKPEKRPTAWDVYEKIDKWNDMMKSSDDTNQIKKQFSEADKIAKELPIFSQKHSDFMYTSKVINSSRISIAVNTNKET